MNDINILKAITEEVANRAQRDARWDEAEEAVNAVLHVLYETPEDAELWQPVYEAIKAAYVGMPTWAEDAESPTSERGDTR